MTVRELLTYIEAVKPHPYQDKTLLVWLNELEGRVQLDVFLAAPEQLDEEYTLPEDENTELFVDLPHTAIYRYWLEAMIDFENGEHERYQNSMELFNNAWNEFVCWFAETQGTEGDGVSRGFYISAYGIAVKHGYTGTEEEWLNSLQGKSGESFKYEDFTEEQLEELKDGVVQDALNEAKGSAQTAAKSAAAAEQDRTEAETAAETAKTAAANAGNSVSEAKEAAEKAEQEALDAKEAAEKAEQAALDAKEAADAAKEAGIDAEAVKQAAQAAENARVAAVQAAQYAVQAASLAAQQAAETVAEQLQGYVTDAAAAKTAAERAAGNAAQEAVASVDAEMASYVGAAQAAQRAAEQARDEAQDIAGGNFASTTYVDQKTQAAESNANKYTDQKIAAIPTPDVDKQIGAHNTAVDSHNDIRLLITELTNRLNAFANSEDVDLDQMAELVAYIKDNRELIEQITTGKVNVSDIINNLTTNVANKPLSAAQGVALKAMAEAAENNAKKYIDKKLENVDFDVTADEVKFADGETFQQKYDSGELKGYTPQKGTDYWTAADKQSMVNDVLAALPTWTGGSF